MFARNAEADVAAANCSMASSTVATNRSLSPWISYPWDIMRMIFPAQLEEGDAARQPWPRARRGKNLEGAPGRGRREAGASGGASWELRGPRMCKRGRGAEPSKR